MPRRLGRLPGYYGHGDMGEPNHPEDYPDPRNGRRNIRQGRDGRAGHRDGPLGDAGWNQGGGGGFEVWNNGELVAQGEGGGADVVNVNDGGRNQIWVNGRPVHVGGGGGRRHGHGHRHRGRRNNGHRGPHGGRHAGGQGWMADLLDENDVADIPRGMLSDSGSNSSDESDYMPHRGRNRQPHGHDPRRGPRHGGHRRNHDELPPGPETWADDTRFVSWDPDTGREYEIDRAEAEDLWNEHNEDRNRAGGHRRNPVAGHGGQERDGNRRNIFDAAVRDIGAALGRDDLWVGDGDGTAAPDEWSDDERFVAHDPNTGRVVEMTREQAANLWNGHNANLEGRGVAQAGRR